MEGYTTENLFQSSTAILEDIAAPQSEMTSHNTEPLLQSQDIDEQKQEQEQKHVSFAKSSSESKTSDIAKEINESLIDKICTKDNMFLLALVLILIGLYFYFK